MVLKAAIYTGVDVGGVGMKAPSSRGLKPSGAPIDIVDALLGHGSSIVAGVDG